MEIEPNKLTDFLKTMAIEFSDLDNEYQFSLPTSEALEKVNTTLKMYGLSFSIRSSRNTQKNRPVKNMKIVWYQTPGINYFGMPFFISRKDYYQCIKGSSYFQSRFNNHHILNEDDQDFGQEKNKMRHKTSKKVDCVAKMTVTQIEYFPDYAVNGDCRKKQKIIQQLKNNSATPGYHMQTETRFYVTMSKESVHNHCLSVSKVNHGLDQRLKNEIRKYVEAGVSNLEAIKINLSEFVKQNISIDIPTTSTAFFPTTKIIYNYMRKFTEEIKSKNTTASNSVNSFIDVDALRSINENVSIFYRPDNTDSAFGINDSSGLVFCFQNDFQRDLLIRYGSIVLINATHRISNLRLPLINFSIKTNSGFMVAGSCVLGGKKFYTINESLKIIKTWNPRWDPMSFVIDFHEKDIINTLKGLFPNVQIRLCKIHVERTWSRWFTSNKNNLSSNNDAVTLINFFLQLMNALTSSSFHRILNTMHESEAWIQNENVRHYFNSIWLPKKKGWSDAFFHINPDYDILLNVHKKLETAFYQQPYHYDLFDMLKCLINEYCTQQQELYMRNNTITIINDNSNELSSFLSGRPKNFIDHMCKIYQQAKSTAHTNVVEEHLTDRDSAVTYSVSTSYNCVHHVDLLAVSCTCEDFPKTRFPCIHMCAILITDDESTFENVFPKEFVCSEFMTIDRKYSTESTSPTYFKYSHNNISELNVDSNEVVYDEVTMFVDESQCNIETSVIDTLCCSESKEECDCNDDNLIKSEPFQTTEEIVKVENDDIWMENIIRLRKTASNIYDKSFKMSENNISILKLNDLISKLEYIRDEL